MATTTTSSSTATASAVSTLMTSLGSGSGIDMSALAANLATAQFAARSDRLTTKSDTLDKQVSAAANLKSMILGLSSSLADRVRTGDLSPQPQIANSAVATATPSGTTTPAGSYSLEVTTLATRQALASPAYGTAASTVGSGTLTLRFGTVAGSSFSVDASHAAVPITIAAGATLADVATAINAADTGVSAYVAQTTTGARLVLKGAEGSANGFIVETAPNPSDPGLANLAWSAAGDPTRLLQTASDATLNIDGLAITAVGNTVTDAIPGVTLKLTATNAGAPTTIGFGNPASTITTAMSDLTTALNTIAAELNGDLDPNTGELSRDGGARALRAAFSQLAGQVVMPDAAEGTPRTLSDLGLKTERDGTFSLDTVRLAATLQANPRAVAAMFTNGLHGVFGTIDALARTAVSTADPGSLAGSITRYTAARKQVTTDQAGLATRQETLRAQLVARFAVTNSKVGTSKSTLTFLQNQIAAWNKS